MLLDVVAAHPDDVALDDLTRRRTWSEELDRATRIGHLLRGELGIGVRGHAAMLVGNRVEFVELSLGALLSGVWITPVNWHLTPDEVAFVLEDSGARVLFVDPDHEPVGREAAARAAGGVTVVVVGDELDALVATGRDEPFPLDGPPGGTMVYTSGTTGRPKGVKRGTQATLRDQLEFIVRSGEVLGLDGRGPHLVTGPLYHAAPVGFAVMDHHRGAPMVVMPRWDPAQTLRLVEDRGVRNTHLVPTMFVRLLRLDEAERARFDPSSLHTVLHGAAPISTAVKHAMIDWWGEVLVEYWGGSEGGVVTVATTAEWLARPGTVGRAVPAYEVLVVDGDTYEPVTPGETGVLYCRHRHAATVFEYHNDPAKTAGAHLAPGTYTLGDVGWMDADGFVHLADRASNMIISGGVNIYPAEVEQVLAEHPAVADVAVFGIPDEEWGEQVKAAVELVDGFEASPELVEELRSFARERLAGYKVPRTVDIEAELPRFPTGKLHTRLLKERYWQGHERRI